MTNYPAEQSRAADAILGRGLMKRSPTPLRGSLLERLVGSLRYVIFHETSVKNGRKLVRSRRQMDKPRHPLVTRRGKSSRRTKCNLPPIKTGKEHGRVDSKPPKILYSKKTREQGSKKTV